MKKGRGWGRREGRSEERRKEGEKEGREEGGREEKKEGGKEGRNSISSFFFFLPKTCVYISFFYSLLFLAYFLFSFMPH